MGYSIAMWQIETFVFLPTFFEKDISLHTQEKVLKFALCVLWYHTEGTLSQNFYLGFIFYFMKSRKLSLKK